MLYGSHLINTICPRIIDQGQEPQTCLCYDLCNQSILEMILWLTRTVSLNNTLKRVWLRQNPWISTATPTGKHLSGKYLRCIQNQDETSRTSPQNWSSPWKISMAMAFSTLSGTKWNSGACSGPTLDTIYSTFTEIQCKQTPVFIILPDNSSTMIQVKFSI